MFVLIITSRALGGMLMQASADRSYIMGALEADSSLKFSKPGVRRLLKEEDGGWNLYKANILKWEKEGRGHI